MVAERIKVYVPFRQEFINELGYAHVVSIKPVKAMYYNVFDFSLFDVV